MFHRTTPAPCRLSARRRLALGGPGLTGTLVPSAFASAPAFADTAVRVTDLASLQDAVAGGDASIQLSADINADNSTISALAVHSATKIDLDGHSLGLSGITVAAGTGFTLTDSTAGSGDSSGRVALSISAAPTPDADPEAPVTGVLPGAGSTFTDEGATLNTTGYNGGAGIGSNGAGQDGREYVVIERLAAGEHVVVKDGSKVIASGHAMVDGSFVFPQAKAGKGTSRLTVHGAAAKRSGKLTVKNPTH